jgi:hypothetical protein
MPSGPFTGEDFQREGIRPVILAVILAHAGIWDETVGRTFGWIIGVGSAVGALLVVFKLANEQGEEVRDRLFGQVLIERTQAKPKPGKDVGVHRRASGAAVQL